ncbi:MAG: ATP-binding protein [Holophagae bacterium]|nr:ATP-binding protein [Holophagae bacterium]
MLYSRRMTRAARLQLLSLYENIELVERVLSEMCHSERVGEETCYWVGMAVREALANAIKHGNKLSAEKRVLVEVRLDPGEALEIVVEDEGDGFDPEGVADPTAPANLMRSSGRGVFYMRQFMDEVHFSPAERGGTRLRLRKNLTARRSE